MTDQHAKKLKILINTLTRDRCVNTGWFFPLVFQVSATSSFLVWVTQESKILGDMIRPLCHQDQRVTLMSPVWTCCNEQYEGHSIITFMGHGSDVEWLINSTLLPSSGYFKAPQVFLLRSFSFVSLVLWMRTCRVYIKSENDEEWI